MPRIRSIKPETWKSENVARRLPGADGRQARLLWIAMWNFAEDHGIIRGNPRYLLSEIFPYEEDIIPSDVERWLVLLERAGRIVRFERSGTPFIWIRGFEDNQRIDKPTKNPTIAPPSIAERQLFDERSRIILGTFVERSTTVLGTFDDHSTNVLGGSGGEGSGGEFAAKNAAPAEAGPLFGQGGTSEHNPSVRPISEATETERPVKRPDLELVSPAAPPPKPKKEPRQLSAQEQLFARLEAQRQEVFPGSVPEEISVRDINAKLQILQKVAPDVVADAHWLFLQAPFAQNLDPPGALDVFLKQRSQWISKATRIEAVP